jgi:hypothetical protein
VPSVSAVEVTTKVSAALAPRTGSNTKAETNRAEASQAALRPPLICGI